MKSCVFCKIIEGDIPAYKIQETSNSLAFLDIKPHSKGHTVVIPRKHAVTLFELTEDNYLKLMSDVKKVLQKIQNVLHPDGFNIGWNHNSAAGQVVGHLHVHIFPRYNGDGGGSMHSIVNNPGSLSVEEVAILFR
ncbi:MAG TPA: HIT family protein [Candidatus Nanoarchaeia archaeon]|nr:HIT family protein [Candidatus Nanoarchaeia archaeon]